MQINEIPKFEIVNLILSVTARLRLLPIFGGDTVTSVFGLLTVLITTWLE